MNVRDVASSALLAGQVALAGVVLGVPDFGAALTFLGGGTATGATVTAACTLLLWLVLVCAAAVQVAAWMRHAARQLANERVRIGALLVVGMIVLAGGVLRHSRSSYGMCCGSIVEVQQAERTAP